MANRVAAIREGTHVIQWRYISSQNNPADEASRGLNADNFLACRRWIKGPDFLQKPEVNWPKPFNPQPLSFEDPEVKGDFIANVIAVNPDGATAGSNSRPQLLGFLGSKRLFWSEVGKGRKSRLR